MNSFRVVDTKFRILKGGKIGLSLSIALIAGMLTLGSTKANAIDIDNPIFPPFKIRNLVSTTLNEFIPRVLLSFSKHHNCTYYI